MTDIDSLMDRSTVTDDGCWEWQGHTTRGYGRVHRDGRTHAVHRLAYELLVGPIPAGLTIDHLCRNRACFNTAHLEPVTLRENILRGETIAAENAAKTHCKNGHPFDDENTGRDKTRGARYCRECHANSHARSAASFTPERRARKNAHLREARRARRMAAAQ